MSCSPPLPPQEAPHCLWAGLWTYFGPCWDPSDSDLTHLPCVLPPKSTAARAGPFSFAGTLIVYSDIPQTQGLPSLLQGFKMQLVQLMKRFLILFLSCPVPGVQLWFYPHLCIWANHRNVVLRLPWSTWVCPGESRARR